MMLQIILYVITVFASFPIRIQVCLRLVDNKARSIKERRMDVNTIVSASTAMEQAKTTQAISIAVLKKALDAQTSTVTAMLDALPPVTAANLPPHLGQHINTKA